MCPEGNSFDIGFSPHKFLPSMDKFWSICAMPIGLAFCFGPAIVAWLVIEWKNAAIEKQNRRRPH